MEDSLLEEIENFERESKSPKRTVEIHHNDSGSETNDEFDEIINRKMELVSREIPGSSPRAKAQSPFLSEDDDFEARPPGKRLGPIGQDNDEEVREIADREGPEELEDRVRQMEEEQEELSSSLMALTSHYAKVQLRLQQVVAAPNSAREELLRDLEQFAFKGIPNMRAPGLTSLPRDQEALMEDQKRKQAEAIEQLRGQLEELESYAYMSGDSAPPSRLVLDRQRLVMEQLRDRLNLNVEDIAALSEEQVKNCVDSAVGQIVNPLKMKSQLVGQLQTQITDLEMFIQFLQEETSVKLPMDPGCGCEKHAESGKRERTREDVKQKLGDQQETITVLRRALQTLQLASSITQLGCGSSKFKKNSLKEGKGNHFGDLRARLELSLERLLDVCSHVDSRLEEDEPRGEEETPTDTEFLVRSPAVTAIVRKELAVSVRDLIHHGLGRDRAGSRLVPFSGCMSGRQSGGGGILHAWDVVIKFYEMKGGAEFNSAPARRLSRSFGLDLAGSSSSNKQALLQTIGQILSSHSQYKRSPDAHFKALVCAGLNKRKLVPWLRLILRNQTVVETMYQPWSYAVTTGFDDTFKLLERLSVYVFDLPVDIAVKQFDELEEAF